MRHITDQNQDEWVERFAEMNVEVEWGRNHAHPSVMVRGVTFTFRSLNTNPDAAEALWNGDVSLALHLVRSKT